MGRKKKKSGKPGGQSSASDDVDLRQADWDEVTDVLAAILEEVGIWESLESIEAIAGPWEKLSESLEQLVESYDKSSAEPSSHDITDEDGSILHLESCAQTVLACCNKLDKEIKNDTVLFELCKDLELICDDGGREFQRIRVLSRRILVASRKQHDTASNMIGSIRQQISFLYHDDSRGDSVKMFDPPTLQNFAAESKRHCVDANDPPWCDAVAIVKELQPGHDDTKRLGKLGISVTPISNMNSFVKTSDPLGPSNRNQISIIPSPSTILEEVELFIDDNTQVDFRTLLLVGGGGSGKTYLCNEVASRVRDRVCVINPTLPMDTMGRTIGEAEDNILSLVSYAACQRLPTILILDGIESVVGTLGDQAGLGDDKSWANVGSLQSHSMARSQSTFFSLLDRLRDLSHTRNTALLVVCTSLSDYSDSVGRFDRTFQLSIPSADERRNLITTQIGIQSSNSLGDMETLLMDAVEGTVGMSFAEISQCCRNAIQRSSIEIGNTTVAPMPILSRLKEQLQSRIPESLRSGANDDFVDLTVLSARELLLQHKQESEGNSIRLPVLGEQAEVAWKEMEKLLLVPLCQSEALNRLMFEHDRSNAFGRKIFSGGALLTGPPGCGKTTISYHCARVAASIMPTVKLVDVSCTSLIHKEVGGSERAVHKLFEIAKAAAPCILIMDGLENIAPVRGNDNTTEGTMDRVLSTLLTELDGVDNESPGAESSGGIAIIGITHNPNWIDPALRRPGRIEKEISLTYPNSEAVLAIIRKEISANTTNSRTESSLPSHLEAFLVKQLSGMSGASIVDICDQAKIICARRLLENLVADNGISLSKQDFVEALGSQYREI